MRNQLRNLALIAVDEKHRDVDDEIVDLLQELGILQHRFAERVDRTLDGTRRNLVRCLASVQGWVAEIVVALNDTTDASEAIARAGMTRIDEVPIVDGLAASVKMAEAMADLKKLGISVTRRGYTHARPPADVLEHARQFHKRI